MRNTCGLALLWATLAGGPGFAQRALHDDARDVQAEAAAAASKNILSGSLFETQLKNLEQLGKQQLQTILLWQEVRMRAALNGFSTWGDVARVLNRVDTHIAKFLDIGAEQAAAAERLDQIKARAATIPKLLQDIQAKDQEGQEFIAGIVSHLGDAKEAVDFAADIAGKENPAKTTALNEVGASLERVQKLFESVKGMLAASAAVSVPVASLRPDPLRTEVELLRVEEEHWKTLGLIRARQALETGDIKTLVDRARAYAGRFPAGEKIEDTLLNLKAQAQRDRLEFALFALHYAAAVAAQQETSADLAALRKSLEERRYSIQRSAVNAAAYEQTARAAAGRLAIYWRSGLKAKDVGELLYYFSVAASLPALAARQ